MKPFLIEIGSEEIPARFVHRGLELLKEGLSGLFEKNSIEYGEMKAYATPRRLTILVKDLSEKQKDSKIESLGPPKKIAFDENGNPTKAATGFAQSLNLDVSQLTVKKTDRGEYIAAIREEKGRDTLDVLREVLPGLISSLQLPKSMRWGDSTLRFFRPVQWILALLGSDVVPFKIDGIKSSNISYGHRFLSPVALKIHDPSSYLPLLKQNHVLADLDERKNTILAGIKSFESSADCSVHIDPDLLDTVTNLVEYPTVTSGTFDEKYLALPKELLIIVMKSHQKYFSTGDKEGNMTSSFVLVSNTKAENNETVRKGAERVLRARLEDAQFYYSEDRSRPFGDYVEELKKVTFQEKLGSLYQKAERISALATVLSKALKLKEEDKLHRAAMLCKADLVTGVVGEFPELQGYMGMIYAAQSGENSDVASSVYEHYLPKYAGDSLPSGITASLLSLSDKMDNIASFFLLDMIPTGSEDPFALRRQALGIINILQENDLHITLNFLVNKSLENHELFDQAGNKREKQVLQFFRQRLEGFYLSKGYTHDAINAALSSAELNITDVSQRIKTIADMKKESGFAALLTAAKRVYNILAKVKPGNVEESRLTESQEKELFRAAGEVKIKLDANDFRALFDLEQPVNSFFDNILVMDKDPAIRDNRLALLLSVKRSFDLLGDFSQIVD